MLIPILYLKDISTGDFEEALTALLGKDAPGLSASTIARLKEGWRTRTLAEAQSLGHRTIRSKGCLSNKTALAMVFKLVEGAQKSWRRLDGDNQLPKIIQGVKFTDGLEIAAKLETPQAEFAAA